MKIPYKYAKAAKQLQAGCQECLLQAKHKVSLGHFSTSKCQILCEHDTGVLRMHATSVCLTSGRKDPYTKCLKRGQKPLQSKPRLHLQHSQVSCVVACSVAKCVGLAGRLLGCRSTSFTHQMRLQIKMSSRIPSRTAVIQRQEGKSSQSKSQTAPSFGSMPAGSKMHLCTKGDLRISFPFGPRTATQLTNGSCKQLLPSLLTRHVEIVSRLRDSWK